jgi:hypothetical protein
VIGLLPCLLLCLGGSARAFNGWEHEAMSQLSLLVASNYVSVTLGGLSNANERLPIMRETVATFYKGLPESAEWRNPKSAAITYGEIAMLVDYMKDNYDMLHLPHSRVNLPVDAKTSNLPYLRSLLDHGGKVISLASASHDAYNHFQGRSLNAFCTNHKLAVMAASETNLWGALMLSAYSLHFLEDFFAAGHLLTPRDANAHDLDVALMHDAFNDQGLMYVIGAPQQVTNAADTARAFLEAAAPRLRSQDGKPKHMLCLTNDALDEFCQRLATPAPLGVFCYGDDKMTTMKLQPVLMMLYCSRAISDVLESYVRGAPVNSFPDYVWDRRTLGFLSGFEGIDVKLPYGELTCSNRVPQEELVVAVRKLPPSEAAGTNYNVMISLTSPIYRNPGFAVSLGFESVSDWEATHLRGFLEVEGLLTGGRRDISRDTDELKSREFPRNLWPRSWGLTVGYSGVYGEDDVGQGAFARVIWPITPVNLQVSAQVGARYLWGQGVSGFRDFEMLRVDWGIHMLTIFVGVGHDYNSRPNKDFYSGLAFEAGISLALPYSKIKNLGSLTE